MEQVFFNFKLSELEPIFKSWVQESIAGLQLRANEQPKPKYITKQEAAKLLKCAPGTIDNFRRRGQIEAYNIGRNVLFKETELVALLEHAM